MICFVFILNNNNNIDVVFVDFTDNKKNNFSLASAGARFWFLKCARAQGSVSKVRGRHE
jgi:hypothetical protein